MSKDRSEPAFPLASHYPGMTLRDYFAAKAMQAMIQNEALVGRTTLISRAEGIPGDTLTAVGAYQLADAMLAERAK